MGVRSPEPPDNGSGRDQLGSDSGRQKTLRYQPAFDGMRCIGVISVMCAHAAAVQKGFSRFGCFMAVDMFFVISGYLITTLLLRERAANGRVSLPAFYLRRFARLYPLICVIVLVAIAQQIFFATDELTPTWPGIGGIAFYFSNFVRLTQLVDPLGGWGPLWSLSIEEQFYAVWPIAFLFLLGRFSRIRRPMVTVALLTFAIWAWRIYSWNTSRAQTSGEFLDGLQAWNQFYYSTFQRPDGLLIGCFIALALSEPQTKLARSLIATAHALRLPGIIGICVIIWATASKRAGWQVIYGVSAFNVLIALLLVELLHYPSSHIAKVLSFRPLTWIGRRSYFIYAVHYIILSSVFFRLGFTSIPAIFATAIAIFAFAGLSYRYYEGPMLRWGHRSSRRIIDRSLLPSNT